MNAQHQWEPYKHLFNHNLHEIHAASIWKIDVRKLYK